MNEANENGLILLLLTVLILVSLAVVFLRWKPSLPKLKKDKVEGGDHGNNTTSDDNKVTQLIATGVLTLVAVAGLWWYDVDLSTLVNKNPLIALAMFTGLVVVFWCVVAYILEATTKLAKHFGAAILIGMATIGILSFVIEPGVMTDWLKTQATWVTKLFKEDGVDEAFGGTWAMRDVVPYIILLGILLIGVGYFTQKKEKEK